MVAFLLMFLKAFLPMDVFVNPVVLMVILEMSKRIDTLWTYFGGIVSYR